MRFFFAFLCCFAFYTLHAEDPKPDKPKPKPQKVYTGIYLMNVYDLDINGYSFYADFYIWFRWKGKLDPTKIEFVNSIEKWGVTETMFHDTAKLLPDGYYYNGMRFEGRFYHSFQLQDFPVDYHPLDIRIESVEFPADSLVYVPDTSKVLLRKDFKIPGWEIKKSEIITHNNAYQTNFGEPTGPPTFSNFTFALTIGRPLSYFLLKLLLPLLVMLIASLMGLFIHPEHIDARISLPIGGLLSCVFLQQSYSTALPDVGYMVLMDRIYLVAYFLISVILLRIMMGSNLLSTTNREADLAKVWAIDRKRAYQLMVFIVVTISILILIR
jgi:hypothetical protein